MAASAAAPAADRRALAVELAGHKVAAPIDRRREAAALVGGERPSRPCRPGTFQPPPATRGAADRGRAPPLLGRGTPTPTPPRVAGRRPNDPRSRDAHRGQRRRRRRPRDGAPGRRRGRRPAAARRRAPGRWWRAATEPFYRARCPLRRRSPHRVKRRRGAAHFSSSSPSMATRSNNCSTSKVGPPSRAAAASGVAATPPPASSTAASSAGAMAMCAPSLAPRRPRPPATTAST